VSLSLVIIGLSLLVSLIATYLLYQVLSRKLIHQVRPWGPETHLRKAPVPTGGGLLFAIMLPVGLLLGFFPFGSVLELDAGELPFALTILVACTLFALLGFTDDYLKAARGSSTGLPARYKLPLQAVIAVGSLLALYQSSSGVFLLWPAQPLALPLWLYLALGGFLLVGLVNAMNFTDGADGLAAGMALLSLLALACAFTLLAARQDLDGQAGLLSYLCLVGAGAAGAFLSVNFKPALIYMGDTGSYYLGAFIGLVAIAGGLMLFLIPLALVYGLELLSVVLQVAYFRLSGGRRIFKMSPLHHHFELSGLGELRTVLMFWAVHAAVSAGSVALFYWQLVSWS